MDHKFGHTFTIMDVGPMAYNIITRMNISIFVQNNLKLGNTLSFDYSINLVYVTL